MNIQQISLEELLSQQRKLQADILRLQQLLQENGKEVERRIIQHDEKKNGVEQLPKVPA